MNLTDLVLRNALISGSIPYDIEKHESLQILDLSFNNLTGELSSSLFYLTSLTHLFLGNNSLSGELPDFQRTNLQYIDLSYNYLSGSLPEWANMLQLNLVANMFVFDSSNITNIPGLNCLQRNFSCNKNTPHYTNFSIKCGGPEIRGKDGILYEAENEFIGKATFLVMSTDKWAVSHVGWYSERAYPSYFISTPEQSTGTNNPELFQTARASPGSLRYYGLGLVNGPYTVTLQFSEIGFPPLSDQTWKSLGRRMFDIYIQGHRRVKDLDISKEAGGVQRAIAKEFKVNVSENYLEIHLFWAGKGTCCIPVQGYYGPLIATVHAASGIMYRHFLMLCLVTGAKNLERIE